MKPEDKLRSYKIMMGTEASIGALTAYLTVYSVLEYSSSKDPLWLLSTILCFLGTVLLTKDSYQCYKWIKELSESQKKQGKLEDLATE